MSYFGKEAFRILVNADMNESKYEEIVERLVALHNRYAIPEGHMAISVEYYRELIEKANR